jgi:hypothetical protein
MTPEEKDFLLAEYKASSDIIQNIENRCSSLATYYVLLFVGAVSIVSALLSTKGITQNTRIGLIIIMAATGLAGILTIRKLLSDRGANIDYYNRTNLIRKYFLSGTTDQNISAYFRTETQDPNRTSSFLKWIFAMIGLQAITAFIIALVGLLRAAHFDLI